MDIALYIVAGLLIALLTYSAALKLSGRPDVVAAYARVGVARRHLPALAAVILAGAAGVLAGFVWAPLGVVAAASLAVYFVLALVAHATHGDMAHAGTPLALLLLASACVALFISSGIE